MNFESYADSITALLVASDSARGFSFAGLLGQTFLRTKMLDALIAAVEWQGDLIVPDIAPDHREFVAFEPLHSRDFHIH